MSDSSTVNSSLVKYAPWFLLGAFLFVVGAKAFVPGEEAVLKEDDSLLAMDEEVVVDMDAWAAIEPFIEKGECRKALAAIDKFAPASFAGYLSIRTALDKLSVYGENCLSKKDGDQRLAALIEGFSVDAVRFGLNEEEIIFLKEFLETPIGEDAMKDAAISLPANFAEEHKELPLD